MQIKKGCKYFHPTKICTESFCENNKCTYRHPNYGRYVDQYRRKTECVYSHNQVISNPKPTEDNYQKVLIVNIALKSEFSDRLPFRRQRKYFTKSKKEK